MDVTNTTIGFECDICLESCGSKVNLENHVKIHVKKTKQEIKCKAYYLGANSFGQISDFKQLECREPHLISESVSFVGCSFSSLSWLDEKRHQLYFNGLKNGVSSAENIHLQENAKFNLVYHGTKNVWGVSDGNVVNLLQFEPQLSTSLNEEVVIKLMEMQEEIELLKCHGSELLCLSSSGIIWNLTGANSDTAQVGIPGRVKLFACGEEHCLAVTEENEVYSWGNSLKGQLGRGTLASETFPERIPALGGLNIIEIDCGKWHSVALTSEGDLYVWGWNKYGQLGLPCPEVERPESIENSTTVLAEPTLLDFPIGVRKIACGSTHTVVLADDMKVWGCGFTKFGQLGNHEVDKLDRLTVIETKFTGKITDIKAHGWSTLIFVENNEIVR